MRPAACFWAADKSPKPKGVYVDTALPTLSGLRLSDAERQDIAAFARACHEENPKAKINWCKLAASAAAIVAQLAAAGVAIPSYLTIVLSVLESLCPTPPPALEAAGE